jgi:hypothetical protein
MGHSKTIFLFLCLLYAWVCICVGGFSFFHVPKRPKGTQKWIIPTQYGQMATQQQDPQGQTFDLETDLCDLPYTNGKKLLMRDESFDGHVLSARKKNSY